MQTADHPAVRLRNGFDRHFIAAPQRAGPAPLAAPADSARIWEDIGPGWYLVLWERGTEHLSGSAREVARTRRSSRRLHLVEPARRRKHSVAASYSTPGDQLVAWSGDGCRALVSRRSGDRVMVTEIDLVAGQPMHRFAVGADVAVSYTSPNGLAIIVDDGRVVRWLNLGGTVGIASVDDHPVVGLSARAVGLWDDGTGDESPGMPGAADSQQIDASELVT